MTTATAILKSYFSLLLLTKGQLTEILVESIRVRSFRSEIQDGDHGCCLENLFLLLLLNQNAK